MITATSAAAATALTTSRTADLSSSRAASDSSPKLGLRDGDVREVSACGVRSSGS